MQARRTRLVLLAVLTLAGSVAWAGGDWNDAQIAWKGFDEGLRSAKETGKPICLVFYTEWCSHCTAYSKVFHDDAVVAKSKQFVMVRLDKDKNKELSAKHAPEPNGQYIPRTFFLSSDGQLDPTLDAARREYKYFYDESDPASLLSGMDRALAKLVKK